MSQEVSHAHEEPYTDNTEFIGLHSSRRSPGAFAYSESDERQILDSEFLPKHSESRLEVPDNQRSSQKELIGSRDNSSQKKNLGSQRHKHRLRSRPEDIFDCYVVTEPRLIPAKLSSVRGFIVNFSKGKVEVKNGDICKVQYEGLTVDGIAEERQRYQDLDCDFVVVDERDNRTAVRIRPQGEVPEPNCTVYTDKEVLMGRGYLDVNGVNGILLDSQDQTHRAIVSFPNDDIASAETLSLYTKSGTPRERKIIGRREEVIAGYSVAVFKLVPEIRGQRAELLFIFWPLTPAEPTPLLNGVKASLQMQDRPEFNGEIICKPTKGDDFQMQLWLPWKAQSLSKWIPTASQPSPSKQSGSNKSNKSLSGSGSNAALSRPRYLIIDLDAKPSSRLNDLELGVKQWAYDERNKNKPARGEWIPPLGRNAGLDGLEFGIIDEKGNRVDVRIDEEEEKALHDSQPSPKRQPAGYTEVHDEDELNYKVQCWPYADGDGKGLSFGESTEGRMSSSGGYNSGLRPDPVAVLVSLNDQYDNPYTMRGVGKMRRKEIKENPTSKMNAIKDRAARTIQAYCMYNLNKLELRRLTRGLLDAHRMLKTSKHPAASWRGFLRHWSETTDYSKDPASTAADYLRRISLN